MTVTQIKAAVRERDGFRCTQCGMTSEEHRAIYGRELEVHRLTPGSKYELDICVTLCKRCHGPMPRCPLRDRHVLARERGFAFAKLPTGICMSVESLAAFYGVDANDYLTDLVEPIVAQRMSKMGEEIAARARVIRRKNDTKS